MAATRSGFVATFALAFCLSSCGSFARDHGNLRDSGPGAVSNVEPKIIDTSDPPQLGELVGQLDRNRVLFIGEVHDRLEHHHNQLKIIKSVYARYPDLAIGVEYFQKPFQPYLDDYIAGRITEREMLVKTEYFKRWQLDFRLLQPIFQFARANRIPIIALNVSDEIHNKVFIGGMKSLSPQELAQTPADMEPASESYLMRLKSIFNSHPTSNDFDAFVEGVLLWDESMADTAAHYLKAHPESRMVVLAGMVHVMYGDGIPGRLDRRLGSDQSVVAINGNDFGDYPGIADYQLVTKGGVELPKAGKLGVSITDGLGLDGTPGAQIRDFSSGSAAQAAGLAAGDVI
ncbi:MAG: ChaN family lipoprotein, partial [Gallionella sp.]